MFEDQWALKTSFGNLLDSPKSRETSPYKELEIPKIRSDDRGVRSARSSFKILPPITSRTDDDVTRCCHDNESSSRSCLSAYEERITNEWKDTNLSSSLILRRVRKMRGVRKKSDDADKKLKRFQKLQQKLQHRQQQQQNKRQKQTTPRIEYFKGRQQLKEKQLEEETKQKNRYTYEWIDSCLQYQDVVDDKKKSLLPPINSDNSKFCLQVTNQQRSIPKDHVLNEIIRRHKKK